MEEDNNQSTAVKQNPLMIAVVAGVLILGGIGFLLTRSGSGRPASSGRGIRRSCPRTGG